MDMRQPARGRADHVAEIAETVVIGVGGDGRIDLHAIPGDEVGNARRMHAQLQDHGRRLRAVIGNLVARTNFHRTPLPPAQAEPWRRLKMNGSKKFYSFVTRPPICGRRDLDGDLHGEMVRRAPDPSTLQRNCLARIVHHRDAHEVLDSRPCRSTDRSRPSRGREHRPGPKHGCCRR